MSNTLDTAPIAAGSLGPLSFRSEYRTAPAPGFDSRSIAFGLIAFFLALIAVLSLGNILYDPDTYWHTAVGRWIIENGGWPRVDPFSHTAAGEPWIARDWLSQVSIYAASSLAGWNGVALLSGLCIAASIGMIAASLSRNLAGVKVANLVVAVFLLASASFLARPHVIALPLMVIWTLGLLDAVERRRPPHWGLLAVMLIWANAHAGYTIGLMIAGLLAAEAVRDADDGQRTAMAKRWGLFLGLAFLATCLTPNAYDSLLITHKVFAGAGLEGLAYVEEWRSITWDLQGVIGMVLLPLLLIGLALQPWRNVVRILLVLILGWMMIRHARFALLFAFTAVPIAMTAIARGPLAPWIGIQSRASGQVRPSLAVLCAAVALIVTFVAVRNVKINPNTTPEAALRAARSLGLADLKVYNSYNFGGYLIHQRVPTFIDGRTDQLFLRGFFDTYMRTRTPEHVAELGKLLDRHGIGWAIVFTGSNEAENLKTLGWVSRHDDPVATILTPPAR
jgi:hypothetical protein